MDYEKEYKEVLTRAKTLIGKLESNHIKGFIYDIFPELKESEDERIRKGLKAMFNKALPDVFKTYGITKEDALAWLKKQGEETLILKDQIESLKAALVAKEEAWKIKMKQGEQKPLIIIPKFRVGDIITPNGKKEYYTITDIVNGWYKFKEKHVNEGIPIHYQFGWELVEQKPQGKSALEAAKEEKVDNSNKIEPNFKVGDWVVNNNGEPQVSQVTARSWPDSKIKGIEDNSELSINTTTLDKQYHLWTIQDAKDGDVLVSRAPFIYGKQCPYGGINWYNGKFIKTSNYVFKDSPIHPATKEQRDILFKKMKEAGYEWDADKKELKKIEQKPVQPIFAIGNAIIKKHNSDINNFGQFTITDITGGKYWYNGRIICNISEQDDWELVEQKPAEWSEHQHKLLNYAISMTDDTEVKAFLESLRNTTNNKQEWSDKEERVWKHLLWLYSECFNWNDTFRGDIKFGDVVDWLNSLRPQKQWKPTEEQIKDFELVINDLDRMHNAVGYMDNHTKKHLEEILEQIKKL